MRQRLLLDPMPKRILLAGSLLAWMQPVAAGFPRGWYASAGGPVWEGPGLNESVCDD